MKTAEELLKKAEDAFETARELLFLKKANEATQAKLRKRRFEDTNIVQIKLLEKEHAKEEQLWKMAAEMFLLENNLTDKTMGEIEEFILEQGR